MQVIRELLSSQVKLTEGRYIVFIYVHILIDCIVSWTHYKNKRLLSVKNYLKKNCMNYSRCLVNYASFFFSLLQLVIVDDEKPSNHLLRRELDEFYIVLFSLVTVVRA